MKIEIKKKSIIMSKEKKSSININNISDVLIATYPVAEPIDISLYETEPYASSPYRRCKIVAIMGAMSNYPKFNKLTTIQKNEIVSGIEIGCYNKIIQKSKIHNFSANWDNKVFKNQYQTLIYECIYALDYNNNKYLTPRIVSGEIDPFDVSKMNWKTWDPVTSKELINAIEARKKIAITRKVTTMYPCPKCGKSEAYFYEKQIRSSDEGKTEFFECAICSHEWIGSDS